MDEIAKRLSSVQWTYGDKDPAATAELRSRIETTGRKFQLISYSDLVKGVQFHFPNIAGGRAYQIDTHEWTGLNRQILSDCLGFLSAESYLKAGFMCSALVIGRAESKPSPMFFEWMKSLGVLPDTREDTVLAFWTDQVRKAHQWYKYGRRS